MNLGLKIRRSPPPTPTISPRATPEPSPLKDDSTADRIPIQTKLVKAVGDGSRYAAAAVRALPTPPEAPPEATPPPEDDRTSRDLPSGDLPSGGGGGGGSGIVLQATDGRQATCVLTQGRLSGPAVIPAELLPTRRLRTAAVARHNGCWRSSEGDRAPAGKLGTFPPVGSVLPVVDAQPYHHDATETRRRLQHHGSRCHIAVGVDLTRLRKIADGLGTTQLTLMVAVPTRQPKQNAETVAVREPIAVCPADHGTDGVAVLMPLQPKRAHGYYRTVRQMVLDAEQSAGYGYDTPPGPPRKRGAS
jgi:hypothetical protein